MNLINKKNKLVSRNLLKDLYKLPYIYAFNKKNVLKIYSQNTQINISNLDIILKNIGKNFFWKEC